MIGSYVHILQFGELNDTTGRVVDTYYDSNTNNMICKVRCTSGKIHEIPASMCIPYFPVGSEVRITGGMYIHMKGVVTACRFNGDTYDHRLRIPKSEFGITSFAHDIHVDIETSKLKLSE
jgi:hypothetical protein